MSTCDRVPSVRPTGTLSARKGAFSSRSFPDERSLLMAGRPRLFSCEWILFQPDRHLEAVHDQTDVGQVLLELVEVRIQKILHLRALRAQLGLQVAVLDHQVEIQSPQLRRGDLDPPLLLAALDHKEHPVEDLGERLGERHRLFGPVGCCRFPVPPSVSGPQRDRR